jgi:hypothetical protein
VKVAPLKADEARILELDQQIGGGEGERNKPVPFGSNS